MVDFQDLKEKLSSLSWIKYLIITIVIIIVIIIVIFVIKYFKNKKSSQAEQFNLSKNNYKESFDISKLSKQNWVDNTNSQSTITTFVNNWKDVIKKLYKEKTMQTTQQDKTSESFVAPRNNFGNAERKYKLASKENISKPQQHLYMNNTVRDEHFQQPRTKKDYLNKSFLNGLSAKTGTNYRY